MAHDVLRALGKAGAREAFHEDLDQRLARAERPGLADTLAEVTKAAARLFARQPLVMAYAEPECLDILAYGGRTGDHAEPQRPAC
jgi:hypothetical protein